MNPYESIWEKLSASDYQSKNYETGMAAYALRQSHAMLESQFTSEQQFSKVLEVGAPSDLHVKYVRHRFDEYIVSDRMKSSKFFFESTNTKVSGVVADAACLPFSDGEFDRVIACHVLEHLTSPENVLFEWRRLVKPGGVLTLLLPCDPGMAWRFGRAIGPRRSAEDGLDYDYIMANEHINGIFNLIPIVRHHFKNRVERYWPFRLPSSDLNLFWSVIIRV